MCVSYRQAREAAHQSPKNTRHPSRPSKSSRLPWQSVFAAWRVPPTGAVRRVWYATDGCREAGVVCLGSKEVRTLNVVPSPALPLLRDIVANDVRLLSGLIGWNTALCR